MIILIKNSGYIFGIRIILDEEFFVIEGKPYPDSYQDSYGTNLPFPLIATHPEASGFLWNMKKIHSTSK